MVRGLIGGVVSGVIVAGAGLGALSVLLPPPQATAPKTSVPQASAPQAATPKDAEPKTETSATASSEAAPAAQPSSAAGPVVSASEDAPTTALGAEPGTSAEAASSGTVTPSPEALGAPAPEIMLLPDGSVVPPEKQMPRVFSAGSDAARLSDAPGTIVNRSSSGDAAPSGDAVAATPRGDALRAYAAPVSGISGRPLMSILLRDVGVAAGGLDPQTIASLKLPVTVVIDPTLPDATLNASLYRASGHEVAVLAAGIPEGATAQDVATAMEAWRHAVPEAIGVVEAPAPQFQNNRILAQQVVAEVKQAGEGLITQPIGLDAASQIAKGEGVPQAQLWKVLDAGRESSAEIGRALDRAAFEGERKGSIAVMLSAWPESVAGLIDWASNPSGKVALAPVSALALRDRK